MGVKQANYYQCSCAPGFTGWLNQKWPIKYFISKSNNHFEGYNCEIQINFCESNPCLNYGICFPCK